MENLVQIFHVDKLKAEEIIARKEQAHRHDFEELIIAFEGCVEHFIDFKTVKMIAPFVIFVTKDKIHKASPYPIDGKCSIWVIKFKSEFIADMTYHLYNLFHNRANIHIDKELHIRRLVTLSEMMNDELQQQNANYHVLKKILQTIFIMIEPEIRKHKPCANEDECHYEVFTKFLRLLEENYFKPEGVQFYAQKLSMSSRNLNLICNKIYQKSVSEIIVNRKITEAKNLLTTTNKTISEIAYGIGYNEKSYFSNVFKKRTGKTPSAFRKEVRKLNLT